MPKVTDRKKAPRVDGAITWNGSTFAFTPARRRFAWSMWVGSAKMSAASVHILRPGSTPPTRPVWIEA